MELKEIKSVRVVPYTIMNSSIGAIWAFIFALLILIFAGAISSALPAEVRSLGGIITAYPSLDWCLPVGVFCSAVEFFSVGIHLQWTDTSLEASSLLCTMEK